MQARDDRKATVHTAQGDWELQKEGDRIMIHPPKQGDLEMTTVELGRFSSAISSLSEGSAASER